MNDDAASLTELGPAAGMVNVANLSTQLAAALKRAEQAEELAAKLHAIIQENTLNNIDWAARVQELGDENERLRELVKLHMAADLARADLDRD